MSDHPWQLISSKRFERGARRFIKKCWDSRQSLDTVLSQLQVDPFDKRLRTHPLRGKHEGKHAVYVTWKYRLVVLIAHSEKKVYLQTIGSHDDVY